MNVSTSVNNFLPFSINNVERMRVDTTGNVGILRSDPAYPLDISGTARISNVGNVDGSLLLGSAGLSYTNATNNISLGKTTANTTVGSGNVAVGNSTLSSLTTGTNNVALGYIAGNTITSGSQNVYVGGNTVPSAASATNEITVGFGATGLGSNTVVLGNSSIAMTALRGNVGIGTTAPAFPLDVNGAAKFRGTLDFSTNNITNANQISATTNLVLQPTTGNVGIATTAPAFPLDVSGAARVSTNSTVDGTLYLGSAAVAYQNSTKNVVFGSGSLPPASGSNNVAIGNGTLAALTTGTNNTTIGLNAGTTITTGTDNVYVGAGAAASAVGVSNEIVIGSGTTGLGSNSAVLGNSNIATTILRGNVGIGTTTPSNKLHINGTLQVDAGDINLQWGGNKRKLAIEFSDTYRNGLLFKESRELQLFSCGESGDGGIINFFTREAPATNSNDYGTERMRITSQGNVGIGTTTPGYTLDVNGTINSTNISRIIASGSGTSAANFEITGLDFSNFMMNEIIISWAHNTENAEVRFEVSYNGTSYFDTGTGGGYEITSTVVSPTAGSTAIQQGTTNVGKYISIASASGASCTGLCKLSWCGNMGVRAPVYWLSTFTRAGQGCSYMHGTVQCITNTGNPIKLRISPSSGSFNAYKWRVIGNI